VARGWVGGWLRRRATPPAVDGGPRSRPRCPAPPAPTTLPPPSRPSHLQGVHVGVDGVQVALGLRGLDERGGVRAADLLERAGGLRERGRRASARGPWWRARPNAGRGGRRGGWRAAGARPPTRAPPGPTAAPGGRARVIRGLRWGSKGRAAPLLAGREARSRQPVPALLLPWPPRAAPRGLGGRGAARRRGWRGAQRPWLRGGESGEGGRRRPPAATLSSARGTMSRPLLLALLVAAALLAAPAAGAGRGREGFGGAHSRRAPARAGRARRRAPTRPSPPPTPQRAACTNPAARSNCRRPRRPRPRPAARRPRRPRRVSLGAGSVASGGCADRSRGAGRPWAVGGGRWAFGRAAPTPSPLSTPTSVRLGLRRRRRLGRQQRRLGRLGGGQQ